VGDAFDLEALRESEARLRRISENALDLIAEVDAEGRFLFVSANSRSVLGHAPEDLMGRLADSPEMVGGLHPDDREPAVAAFRRAVVEGEPQTLVYRYRRTDGCWRSLESRLRAATTEAGVRRLVMITRDVTDREAALLELRQSEERYRVLSQSTFDLVAECDAEGRVVFASPSCEEVIGYKAAELEGTTPFGLLHPDDVEKLAELFLARIAGNHRPRLEQIFRVRHRDGTWRWLQGGGINFPTASGQVHLLAVMRDVSDRVRAAEERRKLEEWLQQAQKLESLGVMAAGVAHDFNNLLTPILGDASLALMDLPADSPLRARLERIQRAAHHASTLTHQLLDYTGIGALDAEPLDMSKLVREMGELLQSAVSRRATVVYELASGLPSVRGDPRLLSQVVVNLLTNASEAVDARPQGGGRVVLRSGAAELGRGELAGMILGEERAAGCYVWFEVEDAGCGMDAETRARMFDPFFTTKFAGRGLGLAAVLGIVRRHGGALEIASEAGRGTRVRVLCPAGGAELPPSPRAARRGLPPRTSGTVLVADDDAGVREIVRETLARVGLEALDAADGDEAIETFRARADSIRLVLLDLTMPGTSGAEALDAIRRIRPAVPVLLVSGYAREASAEGRDAQDAFLQKPFLPETLLERVAALLD
jgi:PAS domain S-box-containing protein